MGNSWGQQPPQQPSQWNQQPSQQPSWGQQPVPQQQRIQQPAQTGWDQQLPQWNQQPSWSQQPPHTSWGQQQPLYANNQQQPVMPGQFYSAQSLQPSKNKKSWLLIALGVFGCILILSGIINFSNASRTDNNVSSSSNTSTTGSQVIQPTSTPTTPPTPTPIPTKTPAQIELDYKNSATSTTIPNLDKEANAYQGKDVHFTGQILMFIKDQNGNTNGVNLTTLDSSLSVVQVLFTSDTDLTRLSENDILEVWGIDRGEFNETNAYGGVVQQLVVEARYLTDQTTNYQN